MSDIKYRELLVKYMAVVQDAESIDFLNRFHADRFLTPDELALLQKLSKAAHALVNMVDYDHTSKDK